MSAPAWVSYVGMVTGIAGTWMGFIAYRRTGKHKVLDLRLDLRKSETDAHEMLTEVASLIHASKTSRISMLSVHGIENSSALDTWRQDCGRDLQRLDELRASIPYPPIEYAKADDRQLESRLVEIYRVLKELKRLQEKHNRSIDEDAHALAESRETRRRILES